MGGHKYDLYLHRMFVTLVVKPHLARQQTASAKLLAAVVGVLDFLWLPKKTKCANRTSTSVSNESQKPTQLLGKTQVPR